MNRGRWQSWPSAPSFVARAAAPPPWMSVKTNGSPVAGWRPPKPQVLICPCDPAVTRPGMAGARAFIIASTILVEALVRAATAPGGRGWTIDPARVSTSIGR